jgi:hypothetical protein
MQNHMHSAVLMSAHSSTMPTPDVFTIYTHIRPPGVPPLPDTPPLNLPHTILETVLKRYRNQQELVGLFEYFKAAPECKRLCRDNAIEDVKKHLRGDVFQWLRCSPAALLPLSSATEVFSHVLLASCDCD